MNNINEHSRKDSTFLDGWILMDEDSYIKCPPLNRCVWWRYVRGDQHVNSSVDANNAPLLAVKSFAVEHSHHNISNQSLHPN